MFRKFRKPLISIMALGALALAACSGAIGASATPTPEAVSNPAAGGMIAEGRIVPRQSTDLFFQTGGLVEEVLVKEGQEVARGTPLVTLGDRATALANVAAAQLELLVAQQAMDDLVRTAGLGYQEAVLAEIAAETAYQDAQASWDDFDEDAQQTAIDEAEARVATTESDVEDAQAEFDKYAALDEDNDDRQRTETALEDAELAYHEAERALAELENEGAQLQAELAAARARYDEATRSRSQRADGPDPDDLALAQARLESAKSALAAAQFALDGMTVVAPYDGVVASLDVSPGERVTPNAPVISFADFSEWYVETTDLSENEVVSLSLGQPVRVVADALPDTELTGVVESIAQAYTEKSGDILYKTRVHLDDPGDTPLRWGMTVEAQFGEEGN